jgi:uncharacterized membrane protein YcaP (DUF421 family)
MFDLENFYEMNPFYPKWPWGIITKQHWEKIEKDNQWFRECINKQKIDDMESAPF